PPLPSLSSLPPPPPPSPLFPYTTLFRSSSCAGRTSPENDRRRDGRSLGLRHLSPAAPAYPRRRPPSPAARRRRHAPRGSVRGERDRKSTRLNSSHVSISYAVFCLKKKKN